MGSTFKNFCIVGRAEGISLLVLLLIAMPIKYILHEPILVKVVGMAHGLLFVGYCALAYLLSEEQSWDKKKLFLSFFFSVLPGGTFYFEKKYL
jgi:integral membrane protein